VGGGLGSRGAGEGEERRKKWRACKDNWEGGEEGSEGEMLEKRGGGTQGVRAKGVRGGGVKGGEGW